MVPIDLLVVGAGPAGLSAAITARRRNKSVLIVSKEAISNKLRRAHQVDNYPGIPAVSGTDLADRLRTHAQETGTTFQLDEIQSMAAEAPVLVAFGRQEEYRARTVVLAPGVAQHPAITGEEELLGRGVSYCATCDAMFFRGRPVGVVAYLPSALEEALFLAEVCSQVYYFPQYKPYEMHDRLTVVAAKPLAIEGQTSVNALLTDKGRFAMAAVFIEREALPMGRLLPGLTVTDGFVEVDRHLRTNLPGVFAAGDCTGRPWQIARAIGEGQVAALSAVDYLAGLALSRPSPPVPPPDHGAGKRRGHYRGSAGIGSLKTYLESTSLPTVRRRRARMQYLLGIDIGTSGTKAILITPDGRLHGSGLAEYGLSLPKPGWAEQDPVLWWEATVAATRLAMAQAQADAADVIGIGLSGQMHGSVFLDRGGKVIRPALLWCDQRTADQCREITVLIGAERLLALVANPALTGFTAPKVLWLRDQEPEHYGRIAKILLPKDYVRYRLTGAFATEVVRRFGHPAAGRGAPMLVR